MPQKEQTITIQSPDTDTALSVAYEAFRTLNWTPQYAGPDKLLATTERKWNNYPQQIVIGVAGAELSISSKMVNGESFDMGGRNTKNVQAFVAAYQLLESSMDLEAVEENRNALNILRVKTQEAAEEDARQSAEVEQVMHLSQSNLIITYSIIAINVLVFTGMAVTGVSLFAPTSLDIIKWGGDFGPLVLGGEWWRLLTNVFVHIGILHIAFNMYALYMIGIYLEPMLGKLRYTVAYLCTGVVASITSLWWHLGNPTTSAGASGAIFGMYGVFLALLSTSLIPKTVRAALLQSIGIFVVFNLVYGLKSRIDNSAHIGGLLSGLVIGYVYYLTLKKETFFKGILFVSACIVAATVAGAYLFLDAKKNTNVEEINQLKNELKDAGYPDVEKYRAVMEQFAVLEDEALKPFNDSTAQTDRQLADRLYIVSEPKWQEAAAIISRLKDYNVSEGAKKKAVLIGEYVQLRLEEIDAIQKAAAGNATAVEMVNEIRGELQKKLEALRKLQY